MSHTTVHDLAAEVTIQPGAGVSKLVHRGDGLNVTVFRFDAVEGLTEHESPHPAIVHVLAGRMRFTVDDEEIDAGAGCWIHMSGRTPHSRSPRSRPSRC